MCTLLVFAQNNSHIDAKIDVMCWKRGDVVQVYEDDVCKENPAPDSKFVFIQLPGVTVKDVIKYLDAKYDADDLEVRDKRKMIARRHFSLDLAKLSKTEIDILEKNKVLELKHLNKLTALDKIR